MKYRLAPFCRWHRDGEFLVLVTPDHELKLASGARKLLEALRDGWQETTPEIETLAEFHAVISDESHEADLLHKLERYLNDQGVEGSMTRKGSTIPLAALPRLSYTLETGTHAKGHGQADERGLAMLKATVEVYERLSCDAKRNAQLMEPPDSQLPGLDPGLFVKYQEWQLRHPKFPYQRTPSTQWLRMKHVQTGDFYRLPLELVCYPDRIKGSRMTSATSSGVAAHPSYKAALLGSAYEVIERDALMVHWLWGQARERINPPPSLKPRVARLQSLGFEVTFLNLTLELAPAVLVILQRDAKKYPRLLLGLACHSSPIAAMDKALQEAELNVTFYDVDVPYVSKVEDVREVMDHQYWYDQPRNHDKVTRLIGSDEISHTEMPSGPAESTALAHRLNQGGFDWYVAELNPEGYDATGVHVVRSLVKGLMPVSFGYMMDSLGLARASRPPTSFANGRLDLLCKTQEGYVLQPFS